MRASQGDTHDGKNQESYSVNAKEHDSLSLNSTLYLAYRDVGVLIERHLFSKLPSGKLKFLDYGCGVGLSTQIILHHLKKNPNYDIEVTGVDINEANLLLAKEKLPQVAFKRISPQSGFDQTEKFDLITCNFVLVEMKEAQMLLVLEALKNILSENGILIVTNPTGRAYRPENHWFTFNNQFTENVPTRKKEGSEKLRYIEDQPVKMQVFASAGSDQSFTFFDYFHSGSAYRRTYTAAGLKLLETHKPTGKPDDKIAWCAEAEVPPYKLHILGR
ncbi:MAG: hypothetical protein A3F11_06960 [Gammaproteobacteria bacterium RIFCSPHIGHO2_12_FULL_37_14]|nr:MAG: hypothetical protein A3F11_06960 [Gammaproteobacteria bacterium RIFCSPHIGHO2_12_FULL_37_14]